MSAIYTQDIQTLEDLELQTEQTIATLEALGSMLKVVSDSLIELEQDKKRMQASIKAMRLSQQACNQLIKSSKKEVV